MVSSWSDPRNRPYFIQQKPALYYDVADRAIIDVLELLGRHLEFPSLLFAQAVDDGFAVEDVHRVHIDGRPAFGEPLPASVVEHCAAVAAQKAMLLDGTPLCGDWGKQIPDGTTFVGRNLGIPVFLVQQEPIGVIYASATEDVVLTARDLCLASGMAELVAHSLMSARVDTARANHFDILMKHLQESLTILSPQGAILYESPGARTMMGYPPGELEGRDAPGLMDLVHPDDLPTIESVSAHLVEHPDVPVRTRFRARHYDGSWRLLQASASNLVDEPSVHGFVFTTQDITERQQYEARLKYEAMHDALTGLYNRTFVERRLKKLLEQDAGTGRLAFLYLDINDFKYVNDSFGHLAGDEVLRMISQRLSSKLQENETLARFGGDEFAILIPDVDTEAALERGRAFAAMLDIPLSVYGRDIMLGGSIGISLAPDHGSDFDALFRAADAALYRLKKYGRAAVSVYHPSMDAAVRGRVALGREFLKALANNEIFLCYQPIIDLEHGHIVGAEALVRWNHPTRGVLVPNAFIPVLEESGVIAELGRWVLAEACRRIQDWGISISVNLSVLQLRDPALLDDIRKAIDDAG
ncbi:MAG TPA: diguanylate cyclase, partial [Thermomicrobiales bacterium]|nr:diguanylate cyclase [Thermomicrobiales bacterium]